MGITVIGTMQKPLAGEKVPEIILTPSVVVPPGIVMLLITSWPLIYQLLMSHEQLTC